VAVAGFKRFGDEFGVGISGGGVLFGQPLGHFKTSETHWHNFPFNNFNLASPLIPAPEKPV
jgi:hypothetical protein